MLTGYGNFGGRLREALAGNSGVTLIVAGRNWERAENFAATLGGSVQALALDHTAGDFPQQLRGSGADALVHTSGPFQGQSYRVAEACSQAGCHYFDIADGRGYASGVTALDEKAKKQNVLVVSGASSVPARAGFRRCGSSRECVAWWKNPWKRIPNGLQSITVVSKYGLRWTYRLLAY